MPNINELIPAANLAAGRILRKCGLVLTSESIDQQLEILVSSVYYTLSAADRKIIQRMLLLFEMNEVVDALQKQETPPDGGSRYSCDVLRTIVVSPCRLVTCRYHRVDPEHLNCLMVRADQAPMETQAISEVTGMSLADVHDQLHTALRKMRNGVVRIARTTAELPQEFIVLPNARVCGNCEGQIEGAPYHVEYDISFCSARCCTSRPISHVVLEYRTGVHAEGLLRWIRRRFESIEAAAQALDFPPSVLTDATRSV